MKFKFRIFKLKLAWKLSTKIALYFQNTFSVLARTTPFDLAVGLSIKNINKLFISFLDVVVFHQKKSKQNSKTRRLYGQKESILFSTDLIDFIKF